MRNTPRFLLALALCAYAGLAAAQHGGEGGGGHGEAEAAPEIRPPSPRIVAPARPPALPGREASRSWLQYQDGLRLASEKRLGEALVSFKAAAEARDALFSSASRSIESAMKSAEAKKAKDSISELVWLLAEREILKSDREEIKKRAGGSLTAELSLLREFSPSSPLHGLIDAALLIAEEGGLSGVGDSLSSLAAAAARLRSYPEAEYRIGEIYLAEGESRLAELQFLRAYDMRDALYDEADGIGILAGLAGIYRSQGRMKDYELRLIEIIERSELFTVRSESYRNAMERTLARQGFDRFMSLYRVGQAWPARACAELGAFYLDAGRRPSVFYFAAASNALLTRIIETLRTNEPLYSYAGLADLSSRILADRELSEYASEQRLWACLVLLGESLALAGERESAREIWTIVSSLDGIESWASRAGGALGRPAGAKMPYEALGSLGR